MQNLTAAQLAPLIGRYVPTAGHPNKIVVKDLPKLAGLLEVNLTGKLLKRHRGDLSAAHDGGSRRA